MNAETLNKTSTINTTAPVTPAVDPEKRRKDMLESIAEDCLVDPKVFVAQSKPLKANSPNRQP